MKHQTKNNKMIIAAKAAIADFRKIAEAEAAITGFVPFDWEPDWVSADGSRVPWWDVAHARAQGIELVPAREVLETAVPSRRRRQKREVRS